MNDRHALPLGCLAALLVAGCSNLGVNLNTQEPIKVDIAVKLDVYQHQDPELKEKPAPTAGTSASVEERRRVRIGEIQTLKNNRIAGENHLGLLEVRNLPPGEYGAYVKTLIQEENEDRRQLMDKLAANEGVPVGAIQERQAKLFQERAFTGEWIETLEPGGGYAWKQKGG